MPVIGICSYYDRYNYIDSIEFSENAEWIGYNLYKLYEDLNKKNYIILPFPGKKNDVKFDHIIFIETHKNIKEIIARARSNNKDIKIILLIVECSAIIPENGKNDSHKFIDKILTWNTNLVDNKNYFHCFFPTKSHYYLKDKDIYFNRMKKKFCCLISTNKFIFFPHELYSERLNVLDYAKKNKISLDLFGDGWDKWIPNKFVRKFYKVQGILGTSIILFYKILFKIPILGRVFSLNYKSMYKGLLVDKKEALSQYKFNICYENIYGYSGYVTEKIIDSLICGSIPVYLGAIDVDNIIPKNCYIDRREFKNNSELFSHLNNISNIDYSNFLKHIYNFISSPQFKNITEEGFVNKVKSIL